MNGKLVQWGRIAGNGSWQGESSLQTQKFTKTFSVISTLTVAPCYWQDSGSSNNQSSMIMVYGLTTSSFQYLRCNQNSSQYNYWKAEGTI